MRQRDGGLQGRRRHVGRVMPSLWIGLQLFSPIKIRFAPVPCEAKRKLTPTPTPRRANFHRAARVREALASRSTKLELREAAAALERKIWVPRSATDRRGRQLPPFGGDSDPPPGVHHGHTPPPAAPSSTFNLRAMRGCRGCPARASRPASRGTPWGPAGSTAPPGGPRAHRGGAADL